MGFIDRDYNPEYLELAKEISKQTKEILKNNGNNSDTTLLTAVIAGTKARIDYMESSNEYRKRCSAISSYLKEKGF